MMCDDGPRSGPKQEDGDQVSLLTGQTAVVTGGAQGLGFAIAERFVAEGARVVLGDVNLEATRGRGRSSSAVTTSPWRCAAT